MSLQQTILEKQAETKLKYLLDSESVKREKRYKLGEWFHGEYREKYKKAASRAVETEETLTELHQVPTKEKII